jgi:DNA-directed RNA polymerase subunit H (RpoH/RPB5)
MELFQPGLVYENVQIMFKKRGAVPTGEQLTEQDIIRKMNQSEYVMTTAVRAADDPRGEAVITAIIIDANSKIARAAANLEKTIAIAVKQKKANVPLEILLITKEVMQERLMKKENLAPDGVTISNHPYTIFLVDITSHVSAPKHELVSDAEVSAFCARYHTSKEQFSKLPQSDPQAIWLGLRPGMVVRVIRASETAGEAPIYRICIRG